MAKQLALGSVLGMCLMATANRKLPQTETLQVATVCDLFLDFSQKHHLPETYLGYKSFLQDFCLPYGTMLGKDLKPLRLCGSP